VDLITQLKRDESVERKPYRDSVGKLTIGVGRNLDDVGISNDEIEYLLANDITRTKIAVGVQLPWTSQLDPVRLAVIHNMWFNMGAKLLGFVNTLRLIEDRKYQEASVEMLKSKWAAQVGERAVRLSHQMASGIWQ
jgi:lysozyme